MPTRPATFRPASAGAERRLSPRDRGYSSQWDKASRLYRRLNPICEYGQAGLLIEAHDALTTLVDHLYPQRRFAGVFWLRELWVGCCGDCHAAKQSLEQGPIAQLDELARRLGRPTLAELATRLGLQDQARGWV